MEMLKRVQHDVFMGGGTGKICDFRPVIPKNAIFEENGAPERVMNA
jgi:hypothetical protein